MNVAIVFPTKDRLNLVTDLLVSIERQRLENKEHNINVYIYTDTLRERKEVYDLTPANILSNINVIALKKEYIAPDLFNDFLEDMEEDLLIYTTDDTIFLDNCISNALKDMENLEYDGVVGFNVANCPSGQGCNASHGMISKKFSNRFPNNKVFCPEYRVLYIDEELMNYAISVDKFKSSSEAKILHFHPAVTKEKPDSTHIHHRRNKNSDIVTYKKRKELNLIWGESFETVLS